MEYTRIWNIGTGRQNPPAFSTKISLFLRNRGRWFRISTSFAPQALVLKINVFARIKLTITIENYSILVYLLFEGIPYKTPNTLNTLNTLKTLDTLDTLDTLKPLNTLKKYFDQGVHYHDVLVDLVLFLKVVKCKYI